MKKLLSLPPNLVRTSEEDTTVFHQITGLSPEEYFCTCDPVGHRVGSGGGTVWLLWQAFLQSMQHDETLSDDSQGSNLLSCFEDWLSREKRILLHAGGQSRRLPAYAPSGKLLSPIPVFRWSRGQRLDQDLLSLQLPIYEQIMEQAPSSLHTMVVSGDVLVRATQPLQPIPEADVVCYGLWLDASVACNHGVFLSDRRTPNTLKRMLQKPSVEELGQLQRDHYYLTDIGLWLLSDRAVKLLMEKCTDSSRSLHLSKHPSLWEGLGRLVPQYYDLYSDFGRALGTDPLIDDASLRQLSVAILPLPGGEFYHFGTSRDMIASTLRLQNLTTDQREIMHLGCKPHPSIFVQNSITEITFTKDNTNIWIENSHVGPHWQLTHDHIITGVPRNDWQITLQPGECIDMVPIGDEQFAIRRYHIDDRFDGTEQQREQFPVVQKAPEAPPSAPEGATIDPTTDSKTIEAPSGAVGGACTSGAVGGAKSAEQLSAEARLDRLFAQREQFRNENWQALAANWQHSVFYQLDLGDAARTFARHHLPLPDELPASAPLITRIHDAMFRGRSQEAFSLLREGLCGQAIADSSLSSLSSLHSPLSSLLSLDYLSKHPSLWEGLGGLLAHYPHLSVCQDQMVWGRSPVRIDIAGGWTDTPPYCLYEGGNVVNVAIELNGQPPLQAYLKPSREPKIILHSIDHGATEVVETYEQLADFCRVGSPFSIPKAALALSGFLPQFCSERFNSLKEQLEAFGAGIELTLFSAVPAGSGLGTSSILAATVLGVLSDFCGLGWDKGEMGQRTLILEQMLTTGGGWQDQFGGLLSGVKLLQTGRGFEQRPQVCWLPNDLYTQPEYAACHLLYYTGITRTAKQILAEIVRRMFLNDRDELRLLGQMREHAIDMADAIQHQDFRQMGLLVRKSWKQNRRLDSGTNPPQVARLTALIDDLCLGYKLPGAGGGGYLYMVAKDPEAAMRIRHILNQHPQNANARFVDMQLSHQGLQICRS